MEIRNYKNIINILLFLTVSLTLACSGGGSSPEPIPPPQPTPVIPVRTLELDSKGHFFGVVEDLTSHQKTFTLKSVGTHPTNPITLSGISGNFSLVSDSCSGVALSVGSTCTFTVQFSPNGESVHPNVASCVPNDLSEDARCFGQASYLNTVVIAGASSLNMQLSGLVQRADPLAPYGYGNMQEFGNFLSQKIFNSKPNCDYPELGCYDPDDAGPNQGYRAYFQDSIVNYDLSTTLFATYSLIKGKRELGTTDSLFGGLSGLDGSIEHLGKTSGVDIDFSNINQVIPEWQSQTPLELKDLIHPVFPYVQNLLIDEKGSGVATSLPYVNDFYTSRTQSNDVRDVLAQYTYIVDRDTWEDKYNCNLIANPHVCERLMYKDLYMLLRITFEEGRMADYNALAELINNHIFLTSEEMALYGYTLDYSTEAFNPASPKKEVLSDELFMDANGNCENAAYQLYFLSHINNHATLSEEEKELVKDNLSYHYNAWVKDYAETPMVAADKPCLGVLSLALNEAPSSVVAPSVKLAITRSLINEILLYPNGVFEEISTTLFNYIEAMEALRDVYNP